MSLTSYISAIVLSAGTALAGYEYLVPAASNATGQVERVRGISASQFDKLGAMLFEAENGRPPAAGELYADPRYVDQEALALLNANASCPVIPTGLQND